MGSTSPRNGHRAVTATSSGRGQDPAFPSGTPAARPSCASASGGCLGAVACTWAVPGLVLSCPLSDVGGFPCALCRRTGGPSPSPDVFVYPTRVETCFQLAESHLGSGQGCWVTGEVGRSCPFDSGLTSCTRLRGLKTRVASQVSFTCSSCLTAAGRRLSPTAGSAGFPHSSHRFCATHLGPRVRAGDCALTVGSVETSWCCRRFGRCPPSSGTAPQLRAVPVRAPSWVLF